MSTTTPPGTRAPAADARPRLLIASAGVPHPTEGASIVLFYLYIDRLRRDGYEILHILLLEGDAWSEADVETYRTAMAREGHFDVVACRSPRFVEHGRFSHALDRTAIAPALARARDFRPDALFALDILPAWAMQDVDVARRIVWLGDLNFQSIRHHAFYSLAENPRTIVHLPSVLLGCLAWRRLYGNVLRGADDVIVASKSSEAALAPVGIKASYEPYPWPEATTPERADALSAEPTFLFFGNLTGLGSRSALHFTIEDVYPRLVALWGQGGFRILLAGRGALPTWVERAIKDKPEFVRLGFVPDIDAVMATCHAVLVPISVPVGNRSRILTAMAKRSLVIAHANTALGNPDLVDGQTCLLAGTAADFVERMKSAVADRPRARSIIARAFDCYHKRFHPDAACARLSAKVAALLGATVPAPPAKAAS